MVCLRVLIENGRRGRRKEEKGKKARHEAEKGGWDDGKGREGKSHKR